MGLERGPTNRCGLPIWSECRGSNESLRKRYHGDFDLQDGMHSLLCGELCLGVRWIAIFCTEIIDVWQISLGFCDLLVFTGWVPGAE